MTKYDSWRLIWWQTIWSQSNHCIYINRYLKPLSSEVHNQGGVAIICDALIIQRSVSQTKILFTKFWRRKCDNFRLWKCTSFCFHMMLRSIELLKECSDRPYMDFCNHCNNFNIKELPGDHWAFSGKMTYWWVMDPCGKLLPRGYSAWKLFSKRWAKFLWTILLVQSARKDQRNKCRKKNWRWKNNVKSKKVLKRCLVMHSLESQTICFQYGTQWSLQPRSSVMTKMVQFNK